MKVKIQIPKKLKPFVEKRKRFKVAYGGRAGTKSMTFANIFLIYASNGALIGCFREFQNSIEDSVHSLLQTQIDKQKFPGYSIQKTRIEHESNGGFRFRGLARGIEGVKSMHGFHYFWIEEGQFISEESLKILTPTLREEDSEIWISANALNSSDPFSQRFIVPYEKEIERNGFYEDDLHYIVKINYHDNPWFPATLEQERLFDKEHLSSALYEHIWEGALNDSVDDNIIITDWFDAAIDAHEKLGIKPSGACVVSHDPSDLGTNDKGLIIRHGILVKEAISRAIGDVNEGMDWALDAAIDARADLFVWDCDGIGAGLKRQVNEALTGKKIDYHIFHGGLTPDEPDAIYEPVDPEKKQRSNRDMFRNTRAQYYWALRDRFFKTWLAVEKDKYINPDELISICSKVRDLRLLRSEVCRIPRKYSSLGKIQILDKDQMRKLKIQSPNLADSLMMSMVKPKEVSKFYNMQFDSFFG